MDAATIDQATITQVLADFVVRSAPDDIAAPVYAESVRSFLNWTGCAVGGSIHPTIDIALAAIKPFAGSGQATVLGTNMVRRELGLPEAPSLAADDKYSMVE